MPDQNSNGNQNQNNTGYNPIQNLQYSNDSLKNIDMELRAVLNVLQNKPLNAGLGKQAPTESQSKFAQSKWKIESRRDPQEYDPRKYNGTGDIYKDFTNAFKKQLLDSLAGGSFKKGIQNAMSVFTERFGFDIRNIPTEAGKALSKRVFDTFSKSKLGKFASGKAKNLGNWALDKAFGKQGQAGVEAKQSILDMVNAFRNGGQGGADTLGKIGDIAGKYGGKLGKGGKVLTTIGKAGGAGAGKAGAGLLAGKGGAVLAKGAAALGPYALLIIGIVYTIVKVLGPALKGLADLVKNLGKSFNRDEDMRKKRMENAQKRQEADMKYIAEQPFKILQEAAEKWASTWDANLHTIGQTQGYDKESVYALYEGYAERLRSENLGSVINATDVVDKLSNVLSSGLSGRAAEEFAYTATKLGAAIPTQDFFGYADTYASIAANAISQGKSQEQALALANSELEQFASNLLYSSRELAGGFSTGLKNSASLFQQATQIAQSARSGNASAISGTLTSVSAIIGAVAPDLADSLVSNVVQAAIGGNSNQIVALRSLAGINASNTEFLQAMASDPKAVFSELFTNLANMQNMSPDNYMEVAEGLAEVFGIDKAAFARVDFNYLANAINAMQVNNKSLEQNLALLQSGQTTTSAEQLKAQEINRIVLEEGLAYVIDSEAGRMIQQNMWEEQRANAMMENEYAVNLQGAALSFLEGIRKTMTTLMNFLNPIGFIAKGVANMVQTTSESIGNEQDLVEILKLGAVGGNTKSLYNLTTRGTDLGLTTSLVEMMGGTKGVESLNKLATNFRNQTTFIANATQLLTTGVLTPTSGQLNEFNDTMMKLSRGGNLNAHTGASVSSRYNWGTVGKSALKATQSTAMNTNTIGAVASKATNAATEHARQVSNDRFKEFLASAEQAAANNMSYDKWVATSKNFGIANYSDALSTFGRSEDEIKNYFEENEARQGAIREQEIKDDEKNFRNETREYWGFLSSGNGIFQTALWLPFFGDGQKYDTRMDAVDAALSNIQAQIGSPKTHTVISGLEELSRKLGEDTQYTVISALTQIHEDLNTTFVLTSSTFQRCMAGWLNYFVSLNKVYAPEVSGAKAWSNLKSAETNQQTQASLALANALGEFTSSQLQGMDPQLQTNVLLGKIVVILQAIMQQNNSQAGGLSLNDTISALGLGITSKK